MLEGGSDLNECFLDNVRVPVENLVGELNKGWSYGKYLLGHERTGIAGIGSCKQQLARARNLAAATRPGRRSLLRARLAQFEIELMALEFTALRLLSANQKSRVPAVEASMLKVRGTELRQAIYETAGRHRRPECRAVLRRGAVPRSIVGDAGAGRAGHAGGELPRLAQVSIYGGANEVQRNLIAGPFSPPLTHQAQG